MDPLRHFRPTRLTVLKKLSRLLSRKEKWTQKSHARTASGNPVDVSSARAACWCLSGAMIKVCEDNHYNDRIVQAARKLLAKEIHEFRLVEGSGFGGYSYENDGTDLIIFNDAKGRRFEDIRAVIRGAIARAQSTS